jgi:hypothetical protein
MQNFHWDTTFRKVYEKAVQTYHAGNRRPEIVFKPAERSFLASIGCTPRELYDFVEDWCGANEPSFETVLLITAVRRDYFLFVQKGQLSREVIDIEALPAKGAELAGIAWLPRIIAKAKAKLRGEMPPELMYGCGGDRPFLRSVNIHPADFLRMVWSAGDDGQKVIDFVLAQKAKSESVVAVK